MGDPDYRALFYATPVLTVVLDPDLTIIDVNDTTVKVTGRARESMVGRKHFDVFPENAADTSAHGELNLRASFKRVCETGRPDTMAVQKYDLPMPDGTYDVRYWSPANFPVLQDGKVAFILHRVEDVTDFVRASSNTQKIDHLAAEVLSRSAELQQSNEALREAHAQLRDLNERLEARVTERTAELQRTNVALQEEIHTRARVEEQFRQAQKMEAIGQLAGGIAHDFNNLLTVILGCADGLGLETLSDPGRMDLVEIKEASRRAAGLTRQLLAFSRRNVQTPEVLNLNEVVAGAQSMLQRLLRDGLTLRFVPGEPLAASELDRGLVEQVLLNLVVNARDAMPRGGTVTVETRNVTLEAPLPDGEMAAPAGRYVLLSVTDTGEGMSPETRSRIFMPFFTTKVVGKGTGLGLSMVHGVVKQASGDIALRQHAGARDLLSALLPRV